MADRSLTRPPTRRAVLAAAVALAVAAGAGCASDRDPQVEAGAPTSVPPATSPVEGSTTSAPSPGVTTVTTQPAASSTTTGAVAPTTTTTTTSPATAATVPPASIVTTDPVTSPSLTMAVFWVRPPDDPRTLDIPGYRDPVSGPRPLVVYGSATNTGTEAIASPIAVARFLDGSGQLVAMATAPIVRAGSADAAASLAPGETGDVILVIAGEPAASLGRLTPELVGGAPG